MTFLSRVQDGTGGEGVLEERLTTMNIILGRRRSVRWLVVDKASPCYYYLSYVHGQIPLSSCYFIHSSQVMVPRSSLPPHIR